VSTVSRTVIRWRPSLDEEHYEVRANLLKYESPGCWPGLSILSRTFT
jgi:hypothetical protein